MHTGIAATAAAARIRLPHCPRSAHTALPGSHHTRTSRGVDGRHDVSAAFPHPLYAYHTHQSPPLSHTHTHTHRMMPRAKM